MKKLLAKFHDNLTSYDLVAMTVAAMVLGHLVFFFEWTEDPWWRVPDRILLPIFFLPVGYNIGRRFDMSLLYWGLLLAALRYGLLHSYFPGMYFVPLGILISILTVRLILPAVMDFALKSEERFAATLFAICITSDYTHAWISDYWPLVMLLAMAGWMARARDELPAFISVKMMFLFVFGFYVFFVQRATPTPLEPFTVAVIGNAYVFWLLYNYKDRLRAAIRRRPKDIIEKACSFLGHRSLEIYAIHLGLIYIAYWAAIAF